MNWNKMTPSLRRSLAVSSVFTFMVFGGLAVFGMWSWPAVFVTLAMGAGIVAFWPSNKALAEAERMKELGSGDG